MSRALTLLTAAIALALIPTPTPALADTNVCVKVELRRTTDASKGGEATDAAPLERVDAPRYDLPDLYDRDANPFLPIGQTPVVYLERLIEHFVTHEPGFVTVDEGCMEVIEVELYPLQVGWTVFARYSGHGREERVDKLYPHELSQFAERAVLALLEDRPIAATINRENVLRADSVRSVQRIRGTNHFVVALGTQLRGGMLDTAQKDGSADDEFRLFSPLDLSLGYRAKFESWGIEAMGRGTIGTSREADHRNQEGGHIDFGGGLGANIHVLRYLDPRGLSSFYLGAGGTFELLFFSVVKPNDGTYTTDSRDGLVAGGLDVDLVFGYEFMRASSVQFLLQGELHLPAYVIQSSERHGSINTWMPGLSVGIGVVF